MRQEVMLSPETPDPEEIGSLPERKFLRPNVVTAIEDALNKVGAFGEVHLIIERGHLRFIRTIRSEAIDRPKG
jgi:hypothetical protein